MSTFVINVCQSCIDLQLQPNDSQGCAIYSALKKEFPDKYVDVYQDFIHIGDMTFECLPCVWAWQISNIYSTGKVKPMELIFDTCLMSVMIKP